MSREPMQYASGYSLDLYCRNAGIGLHEGLKHGHVAQYGGETFRECAAQARKDGWVLDTKTRTATCPRCVKAGKGMSAEG